MIKYKNITDDLIRAYSTSGLMITRDGINYEEAIEDYTADGTIDGEFIMPT